jgi:hypothetical protein
MLVAQIDTLGQGAFRQAPEVEVVAPPGLDMKKPPGPQCTVCGREYPALAASSSGSMVRTTCGCRGSGLVSSTYVRDERIPGTIR